MFTVLKNQSDGKTSYQILAPEEIEAYRDIFNVFDEGKKGFLTAEDFNRVGGILNAVTGDNSELCKQFDVNGDGKVTLDELLSVVLCMHQKTCTDAEMTHMFRLLDTNSDGNLDKTELKQLTTLLGNQLSQKEVDDIMKRYDKDSDGKLQYQEFVRMLSKEKKDGE